MAERPPSTGITRPSGIDATRAAFGSTQETKENEITSGINASAVMMPGRVSRTSSFGEGVTAGREGLFAVGSAAAAVRSAMAIEKDSGQGGTRSRKLPVNRR